MKKIVICPECDREITTEAEPSEEFKCRKCHGNFPVKENLA